MTSRITILVLAACAGAYILPEPPEISNTEQIRGVSRVRGTEGQPLTLTCVCRGGFPAPTLAWYRNTATPAEVLVRSTTPATYVTVTVTYTFTPSRHNDKDIYICQSSFQDSHPEPINQTFVQLYLHLKPSSPTVQQVGVATAGSIATLRCETSGFRPAGITTSWIYKGKKYRDSQLTQYVTEDTYRTTSTLQLPVQVEYNGGSVECIVNHSTLSSPLSGSTAMDVHYHPFSTISEGTSITKTEGDGGLVLYCSADSEPLSTITWYHNNEQVSQGRHTNQLNYNVGIVIRADAGIYTCRADNGIPGTTSDREKSITLSVLFPPTTVKLTDNDPGMIVNGTNTVTLTCTTDYSRPVSSILWRKGSYMISAGITPTVIPGARYGGTRYRETLTLTPTPSDDGAVITCSAWNNVTAQPLVDRVQLDLTYLPVIIDPALVDNEVLKVSTKLHHPTNIYITYYSIVKDTAVSCHRLVNNVTQSASVGVVTTETAVIQLPMLHSFVTANGTRATVKLTIDDESELGFYRVKVRNTIGTKTIDLQIISEDLAFVYQETVTDAERAASTDIGPIVGGLVATLVFIAVAVGAVVLYKKRYRIERIKGPGNTSDKYSVHVNDSGTDGRKPPNEAHRVPTISATQDNGPSTMASAGTGPGSIYDGVDGPPDYEYARMP